MWTACQAVDYKGEYVRWFKVDGMQERHTEPINVGKIECEDGVTKEEAVKKLNALISGLCQNRTVGFSCKSEERVGGVLFHEYTPWYVRLKNWLWKPYN